MLGQYLVGIAVDALIVGIFMSMPTWRQEEAFFGVRVAKEDYQGAGRDILRCYRLILAAVYVIVEGACLAALAFDAPFALVRVLAVCVYSALTIVVYVSVYWRVKPLAVKDERQRIAFSLTERRFGDYIHVPVELLVVLLAIVPLAVVAWFYPEIPERVPVHWNQAFEVDRWAAKSLVSTFALPIVAVYMQGLLVLVKLGFFQVKMTLPAEFTEAYLRSKEEMLGINMRLMDWVRVTLGLMLGALSLNVVVSSIERFAHLRGVLGIATVSSVTMMLFGIAYWVIRLVAATRALKAQTGRSYVQSEDEAEHWYGGGLIYFNPHDPALFIEKMVGLGYTINMANPQAYLLMLYLVCLPLLLMFMFANV